MLDRPDLFYQPPCLTDPAPDCSSFVPVLPDLHSGIDEVCRVCHRCLISMSDTDSRSALMFESRRFAPGLSVLSHAQASERSATATSVIVLMIPPGSVSSLLLLLGTVPEVPLFPCSLDRFFLRLLLSMDTTHFVSDAPSPGIRDLPADVLILIFSLLQGQDIARCITVSRFQFVSSQVSK